MLDHPFSEDFPKIQSKPLLQLQTISFHPVSCYLWEDADTYQAVISFQVVVENDKVPDVLPPGLSPASLVLPLYPLKSDLKLFQWALPKPMWRSFFCFGTGVPHLLSAGLVFCKLICDEKPQNPAGNTRLRAIIHLCDFPPPTFLCNCQNREHYLCSTSLSELSQSSEVPLGIPQVFWDFLTAQLKN